MKNIMVTGGCGFIGTNFIRYLLLETDFNGCIINVDKLTYAGNPENLQDIEKKYPGRYIFKKNDICDKEAIESIFGDYQIDTICHFAAESHVDKSIIGPAPFITTNIVGTFNLLELSRKYQERMILFHHVSTDEVYGSLGKEGYFTEETSYEPSSPYSASKASSDHLVRAYAKTYKLPVTISNCSNNYGPYQFPEKLIPLMTLNALEEKPLPVYGDGKNIRDWLYVRDHCIAIWEIMKNGVRGETYNVGGKCEMTNLEIIDMIIQTLDALSPAAKKGSRKDLITFVKDRPGHDFRYAIDSTKLENDLSWAPLESFETGITKTVQWYLDNSYWVGRVRSGEYRSWIEKQYGETA